MKVYALNNEDLCNSSDYDLTEYKNLLSEEKQLTLNRIRKRHDKFNFLLGEWLRDFCLSSEYGLENSQIMIDKNSFGKPYLKNNPNVHFNLSHSDSYVVIALDEYPVGIDIQHILPVQMTLAKRFFCVSEYHDILGQKDKLSAFYRYWTLKESFIKCLGKGLSIPLDSFCLVINQENIFQESNTQQNRVYFKEYEIHPMYKLAVCGTSNIFPDNITYISPVQLVSFAKNFYRKEG